MSYKQMLGLISLSIGAVLTIFALSVKGYVPDANMGVSPVTNSPASPTEHFPENISPYYDASVENARWILIVGIGMVCVGGFAAIRYRFR